MAGTVFIAGKTVWSMPERFKVVCIPCKALYKCSALPFTFTKRVDKAYTVASNISVAGTSNARGARVKTAYAVGWPVWALDHLSRIRPVTEVAPRLRADVLYRHWENHHDRHYVQHCSGFTTKYRIVCARDTKTIGYRGVARILHWGPQKLSAEGARIGLQSDVPFSNRLEGLEERRELPQWSSPSGVRGGGPAANAFLAYLRPTEHFW